MPAPLYSYQFCRVPSIKEKEGEKRDRADFYIIIIDDVNNDVSDDVELFAILLILLFNADQFV